MLKKLNCLFFIIFFVCIEKSFSSESVKVFTNSFFHRNKKRIALSTLGFLGISVVAIKRDSIKKLIKNYFPSLSNKSIYYKKDEKPLNDTSAEEEARLKNRSR